MSRITPITAFAAAVLLATMASTVAEPYAAPLRVAQAPDQQSIVTLQTDYIFSATKAETGDVVLSGSSPVDAAELAPDLAANTDAVTVAQGAPAGFAAAARLGLSALGLLREGSLSLTNGRWSLAGTAADQPAADAIAARIAADDAGQGWQIDLAVASPVATSAAATPPRGDGGNIAACQASLSAFSERNAILFAPGKDLIADGSSTALDELARDLAACPDAVIYVEGHTDADGEAQANLALSVARAEAVIAQLIARNVRPERLYAAGYGEANPIAPNDTAEGKQMNRRIVITVRDEHY